jgi:hypothetical protein
MHRGCVPFVNMKQFHSHYWPTLRPIVEELWKNGHQTLFYAEGKWNAHLSTFAELPDQSIVYHVDQDDVFDVHKKIGHKFCLSGGIPNFLLSFGTPQEVRDCCKKVIDGVARDGGYIMDAGAIMQNDTKVENLRAMTEATREHGVYSRGHASSGPVTPPAPQGGFGGPGVGLEGRPVPAIHPGVCMPWEQKLKELPPLTGDADLARRVWDSVEGLGNMFIWQVLLSF